ncbi:hypothetical protein [Carboxylicivirga sp. N1Y90]|uniref:hypothetical protein n=1 Tax=Carboxylicivirga fragile TaxID=3417571 RepID=UPI003D34643D|nr:hypothetical protein [Marinilabiliaceae bacterium N1Y90]
MAITKIALTNIEALKGFGISDEMITEIETSVDEFKHLIGSVRNIRIKRYANIKEADQLINAGNSLLKNKMDKMMKVFELTQPVFYDVYKRARVIVD